MTSKAPFGTMNEREGIDVLKCLYSYTCAREHIPIPCKMSVHPFSPFRDAKMGEHVRTCNYTPASTFVKLQVNGSLTAHHISAESVRQAPGFGKGGTSVRAHVQMYPTHDFCKTPS